MTNAELIQKIRAEIESRLKNPHITFHARGELLELLSFLSTLEEEKPIEQEGFDKKAPRYPLSVVADLLGSTPQPPIILQQKSEKPMNLDLEIEIEDYVEQRWRFAEDLNAAVPIYLYDMTLNELKDCARHFAKWGAEHASGSSEIPNDLEEAAKKYATEWHENPDGSAWKPYFEVSAIKAFIAGAKWQKEQDDKELSEKIASAYQLGLADKEKQMLKEAVEADIMLTLHDKTGDVSLHTGYLPKSLGIKCDDKVRVIVIKEDGE